MPYLFTQCEPNYCRSLAPLQDTPAIKTTYAANVTVTGDLKVKMSAFDIDVVDAGAGKKTFRFYLDIPIPSYLLAMAVGDLGYKSTGPTTGVITETVNVDKFHDTLTKYNGGLQKQLDQAETYMTPYIWKIYNLLVLPASFPYGGMENPLLTFASPTIMQEDGS